MGTENDLKVGLALSGGGFRATLFHLGSLWRLNELGVLRKIDIITSVSGGSIFSGVLACNWDRLVWESESNGTVAINFREIIEHPIRSFCSRNIDVLSGLVGIISPFSSVADKVEDAYDEHLFHGRTLQQLPEAETGKTPRFVYYATNMQTGSGVRMSRKYLADYKLGMIENPNLQLAKVVAASSAFPPVLSPVILEFEDYSVWTRTTEAYLHDRVDLKERVLLADGGVYDNMGLEAIWKRCETVLVSDAGAPLEIEEKPHADPISQLGRVRDILIEQTRALRKRKLVDDFRNNIRQGTYWGISTEIDKYKLNDPLTRDSAQTHELQNVRTRLNKFSDREQDELINWGYALTDAAMRRHAKELLASVPPKPQWPYSAHALC